jgi:hypothetical protein
MPFESAYVALQLHLPAESTNVDLQVVHAPVNCLQAKQFAEHATHVLFPGL